jgi:hypothetical protein
LFLIETFVSFDTYLEPTTTQMEVKNKPTKKGPKSKAKDLVTFTLKNLPLAVHNRIKSYRRKINNDKGTDFNLNDAYVEFLKEKTEE